MSPLSVVMLTQDVEDKVAIALESAKWADEIIVVDAGSKDKTLEICRKYTDKIFHNDWPGTTTKQWNVGISKATCDWILLFASDEQIDQDLKKELKEVLAADTKADYDGYYVCMKNIYLGKWLKHGGLYPDRVSRLFRNGKGRYEDWEHGTIKVAGKLGNLNGHIIHYSYRNIAEVMEKMDRYTTLEAKRLFEHNFKFKRRFLITKPWRGFKKVYFKRRGYRDGMQGFLFCVFTAIYRFLIYAKLWELKNRDIIKEQINAQIKDNQ